MENIRIELLKKNRKIIEKYLSDSEKYFIMKFNRLYICSSHIYTYICIYIYIYKHEARDCL